VDIVNGILHNAIRQLPAPDHTAHKFTNICYCSRMVGLLS